MNVISDDLSRERGRTNSLRPAHNAVVCLARKCRRSHFVAGLMHPAVANKRNCNFDVDVLVETPQRGH